MFLLVYGLATLISMWLGQYYNSIPMGLFSDISIVPMYGIYSYITDLAEGYLYLLLLLPFVISWIGFFIGQKIITKQN